MEPSPPESQAPGVPPARILFYREGMLDPADLPPDVRAVACAGDPGECVLDVDYERLARAMGECLDELQALYDDVSQVRHTAGLIALLYRLVVKANVEREHAGLDRPLFQIEEGLEALLDATWRR